TLTLSQRERGRGSEGVGALGAPRSDMADERRLRRDWTDAEARASLLPLGEGQGEGGPDGGGAVGATSRIGRALPVERAPSRSRTVALSPPAATRAGMVSWSRSA